MVAPVDWTGSTVSLFALSMISMNTYYNKSYLEKTSYSTASDMGKYAARPRKAHPIGL